MRLYLLLHVVTLGIVESQTRNRTDEELIKPGNQTFRLPTNDESIVKVGNESSTSYKDELSEIESKFGLRLNETNMIAEDDERFQDQDEFLSPMLCHKDLLVELSHTICGAQFHEKMMAVSTESRCDLEYVIRPYNDMTLCIENFTNMVGCYYPNPDVQDFFLYIHALYFQKCSEEELLLADAPHALVVVLTLIPVSLIPVLVFLVVWKSKVRE